MQDKRFLNWWLGRATRYADVQPEKLAAEREAVERMAACNQHYAEFLNEAVFPEVKSLVEALTRSGITHRVSTWGNQLSLRIHLAWRWGELVIMQSHEDVVTFEHHIVTEGESRRDDSSEDHSHGYDLHESLPASVAANELQFYLSRLAMDLTEPPPEPELPPGEGKG
ncbi:MAG: hypothetical protein AAGD32_11035 [Planctomycetota bacterium]